MPNPPGETEPGQRSRRPAAGAFSSVGECLRRPLFSRLLMQAHEMERVNALFREMLPQPLPEHAVLSKLDPDVWTVQTDSSVWATRLRYSLPRIRKRLSERLGWQTPPLKIRVAPPEGQEPSLPPRRMQMPDKAAELIEGAARSISDPDLSAALMRLAQHGRRNRA